MSSNLVQKLRKLAKGILANRLAMALAVCAILAVSGVDVRADDAPFLSADATTGELSVNATPIAVKLIGLVVGIVVAFLSFKFIRPLWSWLGRMISGK